MISETAGSNTAQYTYDRKNRQIEYYDGDNYFLYSYRPDGLRASKTDNMAPFTTQFVWDGMNMVQENFEDPLSEYTEASTYVYGIGLIKATISGSEYYYFFNAHGDVTGLVNASSQLCAGYDYDAFGNAKGAWGNVSNPFRYCGEYYDGETGTYYLRARYYDPVIGRFLCQDDEAYIDFSNVLSLNLYTYCYNNPVSYIDYTGHWPTWGQVGKAVLIAGIAAAITVSVIASAGTVGFVAGAAISTIGVSGTIVSAATTAGTFGTYAVASGIALCGTNRTIEVLSGKNYGEQLFGKKGYEIIENSLLALGFISLQIDSQFGSFCPKTEKVTDIGFSDKQSQYKWDKQMAERGWSKDSILAVMNDSNTKIGTSINRHTQNVCTVYFNEHGGYVVVDTVTQKVVQISEYTMENFIMDSSIVK